MNERNDNISNDTAIDINEQTQQAAAPAINTPPGGRVKNKKGKLPLIITFSVLALLIIAAAAVGVWYMSFYDNVYYGVTVGDVELGGLTRAQALEAVNARYSDALKDGSFDVVIEDKTYTVAHDVSGIRYDTRKTAEDGWVYGRQGSLGYRISSIWTALTKGTSVDMTVALDDDSIKTWAGTVAAEINRDTIHSAYTFDGTVLTLDKGQVGIYVDDAKLYSFVRNCLLSGEIEPKVFEPEHTTPNVLDLLLIKEEIEQELKNPALDLTLDPTGKTSSKGQNGIEMDIKKAREALEQSDERIVTVPVQITASNYTDEEYEAMLFRDVLGQCATNFNPGDVGRTANVMLAAGFCDGVILNPGDVFSYNGSVGPRTYERGFRDAIVYVGSLAEAGLGGGICQVSSSIHYAVLRADLEIVERYGHSRTVSYVPLGQDATVAWGAKDYKFKNNTEFPIKVQIISKKSSIDVKILGTQMIPNKEVKMETTVHSKTPFEIVYELDSTLEVGTEKVKSNGYTGYKTETWRVVYVDGVEVSRTFENKDTYTRYDKVIFNNPAPVPDVPIGGVIDVDPPVDPATQPPVDPTIQPTTDPATQPPVDPVDPVDPVTEPTTDPTTEPTTEPTTTILP